MKKIFIVLLAITPFTCLHQTNAQTTPKASTAAVKAITISCTVSADEKRIVNDKDEKSWSVANPKTLKGHAGDHVSITAEVDASRNKVTVNSVKVLEANIAGPFDTLRDNDTPLIR